MPRFFDDAHVRRVTHDGKTKFTDWVPTKGRAALELEKLLQGYVQGPPPEEGVSCPRMHSLPRFITMPLTLDNALAGIRYFDALAGLLSSW